MKLLVIACLFVSAALAGALEISLSTLYAVEPPVVSGNLELTIGESTTPDDFTFNVAFFKQTGPDLDEFVCGGAIIGTRTVLTSAKCFQNLPISDITAIAGRRNLNVREETEQSRRVMRVYLHPSYVSGEVDDDIALVELSIPFEFTSTVAPIALPTSNVALSENLILSGWVSSSPLSDTNVDISLKTSKVSFMEFLECYTFLTRVGANPSLDPRTASYACLRAVESGGLLPCVEPGAVLVEEVGGTGVVAGVTSWGIECEVLQIPLSVVTRTAPYLEWINQNMDG